MMYRKDFFKNTLMKKSVQCIALMSALSSGLSFAYSLEKPGKDNTGPTDCECELVPYVGPVNIVEDNTVIEGVVFSDMISIHADNVVIRNFVSRPNNDFAFRADLGGLNTIIEDGEIEDASSAAIFGSNYTARRLEVHNMGGDAFKGHDNFVIENNWMYDLGSAEGSHSDGVQMSKGTGAIIRGNFVDMPWDKPGFSHSQCVLIQPRLGPIKSVLIENNWLNGGGICLQVRSSTHGTPEDVFVIDNKFGDDYRYKPWTFDGDYFKTLNILESTGELLSDQ